MRMECCEQIAADEFVLDAPTRHREDFASHIFMSDWAAFLEFQIFLDPHQIMRDRSAIGRGVLRHSIVFLYYEVAKPIGDDFAANIRSLSDRFLDLFSGVHDCCTRVLDW